MKVHKLGEMHGPGDMPSGHALLEDLKELAAEAEHQALGFLNDDAQNPVVKTRSLHGGKPHKYAHGHTYTEVMTLDNKRTYQVVNGIPREPKTDIPVFIGTALGTSIHGHNCHTALNMMKLGFPVVLVGPEGGHAEIPKTPGAMKTYLQNLARISIRETAGNMHEILDYNDRKGLYREAVTIKTGESRDSAVGLGFVALASKFGRAVPDSYLISPPFPKEKPLRPSLELITRLAEVGEQIGSLALHASANKLGLLRHYPRTVSTNPLFLLHVAATVPTLVNGTAGKLAKEIPRDSRMYLVNFSDDPWTDLEGWKELFDESYPNVVLDNRPGNHGDIVHPATQRHRVEHMTLLRDELAANRDNLAKVNWDRVYFGGQLATRAA